MNIKKEVLISQKELSIIKTNKKEVITKAKYGPSKETKIPFYLNESLAFFVATIIGDGHLRKSKLQINIELSNKLLLEHIKKVCNKNFDRIFNINNIKQRAGKKATYQMPIDSKAIYSLLNKVFEIQIGKKSNIVFVPKIIKKSNKSVKSAFLIGIMLTEGGKRRRGYGLSTSSKKLWVDLIKLFKEIGINVLIDKWVYKKYNKEYYGIAFKKSKILDITKACKDKELTTLLKTFFND